MKHENINPNRDSIILTIDGVTASIQLAELTELENHNLYEIIEDLIKPALVAVGFSYDLVEAADQDCLSDLVKLPEKLGS